MLREINPVDFENVKSELAEVQEMLTFFRDVSRNAYIPTAHVPFVDMVRTMSEEKITEIQNVIDETSAQ